MTLAELKKILEECGFPVAYHHFRTEPSFPYLTYHTTHTQNFIADNKVYIRFDRVQIDLYTENKNIDAEQMLEGVFEQHGIVWD
ncbi:MAG: hypothetical protein ACRCWQ_13355, partial [Bacilli bacterium]